MPNFVSDKNIGRGQLPLPPPSHEEWSLTEEYLLFVDCSRIDFTRLSELNLASCSYQATGNWFWVRDAHQVQYRNDIDIQRRQTTNWLSERLTGSFSIATTLLIADNRRVDVL